MLISLILIRKRTREGIKRERCNGILNNIALNSQF